jgi:hypothetical protein
VLKVLPGGREEEKEMHKRFAHLRHKTSERGAQPELFQPAPELMSFLGYPELSDHVEEFHFVMRLSMLSLGKTHENMLRAIAMNQDIPLKECAKNIYLKSVGRREYDVMRKQIERDYAIWNRDIDTRSNGSSDIELNGSHEPSSVIDPTLSDDIEAEWSWV